MDRYSNYAELSAHEREGHDYRIVETARNSPVVVLAPHGGWIEPTTSQIAAAIAGDDYSLYRFEGLRAGRPHGDLHITSEHFDEPRALVANALLAVSIHGRANRSDPDSIWLGGLDDDLVGFTATELSTARFAFVAHTSDLAAKAPSNICNASRSGKGLQLELPRDLRDRLRDDVDQLRRLAFAIRSAIARRLGTTPNVEISSRRADMR